ncbi:MAG: hypothetical protein COX40_04150, partial [Candidatus Omnitrophica bacterium CG23_combo_of_CG06-09_8_20_14_all_40_11]
MATSLDGNHYSQFSYIMQPLFSRQGNIHTYKEVKDREADLVFEEIRREILEGLLSYKHRFQEGMPRLGQQGYSFLDDKAVAEFLSSQLKKGRVFHTGFVKDETGAYWIVKEYSAGSNKNHPKHEMLAWLLAQGRANLAEIRFLAPQEAAALDFVDKRRIADYYLTRVIIGSNISGLPHLDSAQAFAGIFVANILMRKYDHHILNIAYANGIPVAVDHDRIFECTDLSREEEIFNVFVGLFLCNAILSGIKHFTDSPVPIMNTIIESDINGLTKLIFTVMGNFNGGKGFVSAEMLNIEYIGAAILEFKEIDNARELAKAAGYKAQDLEDVVGAIAANQETLG